MNYFNHQNVQLAYEAVYNQDLCESMEDLGLIDDYDCLDERVRPPEIESDRKPFTKKEWMNRRKEIQSRERLEAGVRIPRVTRANELGTRITPRSATAARDAAAYHSGLFGDGNSTYGRGSKPRSERKYKQQVASGVRAASSQEKRRLGLNASYSYDLYDTILEYLIQEGYADTLGSAEIILENMSEDWIEDIMEAKKKKLKLVDPYRSRLNTYNPEQDREMKTRRFKDPHRGGR